MKRLCIIPVILSLLFIAGCEVQTDSDTGIVNEKFMIHSVKWGTSWDDIKDAPQLNEYTVVRDDGNIFAVKSENVECFGQNGTLLLMFSVSEDSLPATGLVQAYFQYEDAAEQAVIAECEKIYGERQSFFLDKNGIENPLNPPAWYSEEMLEGSLSETEKQEYLHYFEGKNIDETRIDALLRQPLVIVTPDEDNNVIRFQGNDAAIVENLRKQNVRK